MDTAFNGRTAVVLVRVAPVAIAALLVLPLAWRGRGSIAIGDWLHYGVALALIVAAILLSGGALRPRRPALLAVAALVSLALWTALSAAWSPLPTLARDEALLALTYAIALGLPALVLRSPGDRLAAVTAIVVVLSVGSVVTGIALLVDADPLEAFREGRLYYPLSYVNAQAAFFLVGFWPAVVIASRRATPVLLRALATGGAGAMGAGWLMTQSKGAAAALAVSGVALFAFCPARLRLLGAVLVAAVPVAVAFGPLTRTFGAFPEAAVLEAAHDAALAQVLVAAVCFVVGLVYAGVDRRVEVPATMRRLAVAVALAALFVGVIAGAVAFTSARGNPLDYVSERWAEFKTQPEAETGGTHFESLGSNRYDFWRVALGEFRDHPLGGVGGRGFAASYLVAGDSEETPARAHSLALDALSETGIVGFLLLAVALAAPLLAAARRLDRPPAAAAFAGGLYWTVHAAGDWIWSFPAVGIPALLLLGIPFASRRARPLPFRASLAAGAVAMVIALVVLAPPWLSVRFAERALTKSSLDARGDLAWARRLDPLSVEPLLTEAVLAPSAKEALPSLRRAAEKEPRNVDVIFQLGLEHLRAGERGLARQRLEEALRLYPRSIAIRRAFRDAE